MISGVTRGKGGPALGRHLSDEKELNEETRPGASRGLVGETIREQLTELAAITSHSRAGQPIYHMHADPPEGATWTSPQWKRFWSLFEIEFSLQRAPFSEQIHTKHRREHRHREYSLVRPDGTTNPMRYDYARREKLSRIMEFETGARKMIKGAHNRAVYQALLKDGRADVAAAMKKAKLLDGPGPRAPTTPRERAREERTGVVLGVIRDRIWAAWCKSDDARSFAIELADRGLWLAQGHKTVQVVDENGNAYDLRRSLAMRARVDRQRILNSDVKHRLDGLPLPGVDEARQTVHARHPHGAQTVQKIGTTPMNSGDFGKGHTKPCPQISAPVVQKTAPTSPSTSVVTAYDPAKPGDWERYCRELTAYWIQHAHEFENSRKGGHHAITTRYPDIREIIRFATVVLGSGPNFGSDLGHAGGSGNHGSSDDQGFPRNDSRGICCAQDGKDNRISYGAPVAARSSRGEGTDGARPTTRVGCKDRGIPGAYRAAVGRDRVETWCQTRWLAHGATRWQMQFEVLIAALNGSVPDDVDGPEIENFMMFYGAGNSTHNRPRGP